ncbi:ACT domain-containing protein [Campylobacter sp.]|uniref:ACT domain-containing protein n=1 Tax=Campylobacter sp. TaxID=205 RepID=UPI002A3C9F5E|nr:ACT domain-containing protein [Campylobacter sp.]MDD6925968.1 ACT domain-containing protein [Campylobacteraceae bacterium]MDY3245081.1 ACT domain-containing protein [Campylobacter sp.]
MKLKIQSGEFVIEKIDKNATINLSDDLFCVVNEFDCYTIIKNKLKNSYNTQIFKAFYIDEIFDFTQSGILFNILRPLKEECISVLVVSAYERDYIFVNKNDFDKVKKIIGL